MEIRSSCWKTLNFLIFITFPIDRKIYKDLQQIRECSENDAKGCARAMPEGYRSTWGRSVYWALREVLLLPPAGDGFWHPGLLGSYFFRCQFSHRFVITFWRLFDRQNLQKMSKKRSNMLLKIDPKIKRKIT